MPWFCTSAPKKKRSSKTRVSAVSGGGGGGGRSDKPPEDDLRNDRPTFAIVLQNYTGLTPDELNVQRGQMVEIMRTDEEWSLVRDMDTNTGHIPKACCLRLDKIEGNFNNNAALNQVTTTGTLPPQSQVINVDTLPRSGSSVNSVEVHQVSNNHRNNCNGVVDTALSQENSESAPQVTPHTPCSSSQVIYEVPRSPCLPARGAEGSRQTPTTTTDSQRGAVGGGTEEEPQQAPPSLPPRSANLPSVADIQRQRSHRPGYLPGCKQSPNPFSVMASGSQVSSEQSQSFVYHQYHNGNSSIAGTPAYPNCPNLIRRGSVPPNFSITTPATGSPNSVFLSRPSFADSPPSAARTPGSTGIPMVAPSPTSARVAVTPGSPNVPQSAAVTPGYAKYAMAPGEGGTPTTNMEATAPTKWLANSTPPSNNREARRYRRHSSDVLIDSTISEDTTVQHQNPRRQSQPCVAALGVQSPPRRPNKLQVRRTLSMQEPKRWGGGGNTHSMGGAAAYATPVRSSVPIHRAASYQEAVLTHDERAFGATASLKPSEILPTSSNGPKKQQATTPQPSGSRPSSDSKARVRSRSSRSASVSDFEYVDHHDDVFLPDVKKPCGIYQCIREYKQKFKGEISLKKDELVIVLDLGRGEWAWAVNSNNKQGLIPKSVLVRYHSSLGVGGGGGGGAVKGEEGEKPRRNRAETGTQTELDGTAGDENTTAAAEGGVAGVAIGNISAESTTERATPLNGYPHHRPPRHHHQRAITRGESNSSILTTTTTDSSPASTIARPPASSRRRKKPASVTFDPKPQPGNGDDVIEQGTPKEWFDTLDSIDAAKCLPSITLGTSLSKLPTSEQVPPEEAPITATSVTVEAKASESSTVAAAVPENCTPQEETGEMASLKTADSSSTVVVSEKNEDTIVNPLPMPPRSIPRPKRSSGIPQRKKASSAPQTPSETGRTRPPLSRQDAIAKDGPLPPRRASGIPQRRKTVSLPQTPVDLSDGSREDWSRRRQSSIVTASKLANSTSSSSPHSSSDRRKSAIPMRKKSRSVPQTPVDGPSPVQQGTAHYHDRISGRGSMSFDNASSTNSPTLESKFNLQRQFARKPLLTAIKDYNPPSTAKNSLPLKKGDILHLQPHMHYPKGWMWVWHTKRRSFGFVPKSYVAYTYDNSLSRDSRRTDSVEDAV